MTLMPIKVKESVIEALLVARVEALGGRCEKVAVNGRRGFFDRLIVLPGGRIIFAELKRPQGGRLSQHQRLYATSFKLLGAEVALIRNAVDIDQLLLRPHQEKRPKR